MASPETIGRSVCGNCGESVAVAINGGNLAYYRCQDCGFEGRHHWHTSSRKFVECRVKLRAKPVEEKPQKAEPAAPAAAVKIPEEKTQKAAPKKSVLDDYMAGL